MPTVGKPLMNPAAPFDAIDPAAHDRADTVTAICLLDALASRGYRHAKELLRRFNRGAAVDALGVPGSWDQAGARPARRVPVRRKVGGL
jgi:hypothetical protein